MVDKFDPVSGTSHTILAFFDGGVDLVSMTLIHHI